MKIRLHLDRANDGLVILESEPQLRSLFVYSQTRNIMRVPLPHILFTVRYVKLSTGWFAYPGIYGSGLSVYGNLKPLSTVSDKVFYLPTDYVNYKGLVCTDHKSDNKQFKSVKELVDCVVTHWWSHLHHIDYQPFGATAWHEATLDQLPNGKWENAGNFRQAIMRTRTYGSSEERSIPDDAKILDEQWPTTLEVKPPPAPVVVDEKAQKAQKAQAIKKIKPPEPWNEECDCYDCRLERGEV